MGTSLRYRAVGGVAAWRIPVLCGLILFMVIANDEWAVACIVMAVAFVATSIQRLLVLDVSPTGLCRGLALGPAFLGPAAVLTWSSIAEISSQWRRPRDFTGLETVVVGVDGKTRIAFSSAMGLVTYRGLVAEVVRRAPHARRTGLTEQMLAEARPWLGALPRNA